MKKIRSSKLVVTRETLRALSSTQLQQAAGGLDTAPADQCATTKVAQLPKGTAG